MLGVKKKKVFNIFLKILILTFKKFKTMFLYKYLHEDINIFI